MCLKKILAEVNNTLLILRGEGGREMKSSFEDLISFWVTDAKPFSVCAAAHR